MKSATDPARRRLLLALGAAAFANRADAQHPRPRCVLTAEQTEGPYFVDHRLNRIDLRSDPADGSRRDGLPLQLTLRLQSVSGSSCAPLAEAIVHVWHCDADGAYSGVDDPHANTSGKLFLRGYQVSDGQGMVRFQTIYPGWYPGRTVHIHFKVRARDAGGRAHELTSQLYFDDAVTDAVMAQPPYARRGPRDRNNRADALYRRGGRELMLALRPQGKGYAAEFDVGIRLA